MPSTKRKASEDASATSSKAARTAAADRVVSSTTLHPPNTSRFIPPNNPDPPPRNAPTYHPQSRTDLSMKKVPPTARRQIVGKTASGTAILSGGVYMPPLSEQSNHSYQSYISRLSSITPTTNAIDEVINEVNHLLQAASEAQALVSIIFLSVYIMICLSRASLVLISLCMHILCSNCFCFIPYPFCKNFREDYEIHIHHYY